MSRPGDRLRRLATRVCTERTRRRLIDPAVADLQSEFAAARRSGSAWRTGWTLGAGYLSIAKVLALAVCGDLRAEACTWQPEERAGARRGARVTIVGTMIATALLVAMQVRGTGSPDWALLSLYLTPSTLALSVPFGLVLGVAWTFHGDARTRKLAVAAMAVTALCSGAMFANLGWLTPEANQAYRQTRVAREFRDTNPPAPRGFYELTWSGMRARLREARAVESPSEVRFLEAAYHRKLAITAAPLPLVGVILALAFRRGWGRGRLTGAAVGMAVAHSVVWATSSFFGARLGAPPIVIGWLATAMCAVAAILITSFPSRARA
jgi:lipopolysaccharide export LptBFGC system permease protein LptF